MPRSRRRRQGRDHADRPLRRRFLEGKRRCGHRQDDRRGQGADAGHPVLARGDEGRRGVHEIDIQEVRLPGKVR